MHRVGGRDSFDRVATLADLVDPALPQSELSYFDVRSVGGYALYLNEPRLGDVLTFPSATLTGSLSHWLEDAAPYLTNSFTVLTTENRASGTLPQILTGNRLQLPGYTFTDDDRGRWVVLTGFSNPAYNRPVQILTYVGDTATIDTPTAANALGATWAFPRVKIQPNVGSLLEPRYFPTRETNLSWQLYRGPTLVASNATGGMTLRAVEQDFIRATRFTYLAPTLEAGLAHMAYVRTWVSDLQRAGALANTAFTGLITSTYGP